MTVKGVPVRFMIRFAYDIDVKASENVNLEQIRPYLQKLLEDRFQLVVDHEKKEVPAYDFQQKAG